MAENPRQKDSQLEQPENFSARVVQGVQAAKEGITAALARLSPKKTASAAASTHTHEPEPAQSTSAAGSSVSTHQPLPGPSTSAEEASSRALPIAPVVKKYTFDRRRVELDSVYQLRTILNDIRFKVVKIHDVISMLQKQLDMRRIPKDIPREFATTNPIPKL